MVDCERIETLFMKNLDLRQRPVAVSFLDSAPPLVEKFEGVRPSGCSFWKLASDGRIFYTVGADHFNCPIGSYTHNISLPEERSHELNDTLQLMTTIGYLRMEEVPRIPRLPATPEVVLYDEPTTGLDPITAAEIDHLIVRLRAEAGVTAISITHSLESAHRTADVLAVLYEGRIIASGTFAEIHMHAHPFIKQYFALESLPIV